MRYGSTALSIALVLMFLPHIVYGLESATIDLSSDGNATQVVKKGERVIITILNRNPDAEYILTETGYVAEKLQPLPVFSGGMTLADVKQLGNLITTTNNKNNMQLFVGELRDKKAKTCSKTQVTQLYKELSGNNVFVEKDIQKKKKEIKTALAEMTRLPDNEQQACQQEVAFLSNYNLATSFSFPTTDKIAAGTTTFTVRRTIPGADPPNKEWKVEITTRTRGEWGVDFGYAFFPNRDQEYYSKQIATDTYVVTRQRKNDSWNYVPVVTYSWQPTPQWCFGNNDFINCTLLGGIGLDLKNPTVLFGLNFTIVQNLSLSFGGAFQQQKRLAGQYIEGQTLSQNIDAANLVKDVYRPNLFFGLTFRFSSNPFSNEKKADAEK